MPPGKLTFSSKNNRTQIDTQMSVFASNWVTIITSIKQYYISVIIMAYKSSTNVAES